MSASLGNTLEPSKVYIAYLTDLGRIGGRHENARKFYVSVISAIFVFLSLAGEDGPLGKVRPGVWRVVGVVGILVCLAWFQHMRSFGTIYDAKLHTLRTMEGAAGALLQPFTIETAFLAAPPEGGATSGRYVHLTWVDRVTPIASIALFGALLVFK